MEKRDNRRVSVGRVISYDQAVTAARRQFHETAALDMEQLAGRLSVSRATLYRVVSSRDRLLGDVLWQAGREATERAVRAATATGAERLLQIALHYDQEVGGYAPLRRLMKEDPATAFQVLFMPEAGVHLRFVELWHGLFVEEQQRGWRPPLAPQELAFVFVRVGESMLYADLLSGLEPDLELAATVKRSLLGL